MSSVVLVSGGLDSAAALFWAEANLGRPVRALTFEYGQRHWVEIERSRKVVAEMPVESHKIINCGIASASNSALASTRKRTDTIDDAAAVVPGRNAIFLALAAAYARTNEIEDIVIGCNADDAAAFPDCRPGFITAIQHALSVGMSQHLNIRAPFLASTKAQIIREWSREPRAKRAMEASWSCYSPVLRGPHCNDFDICGTCSACIKRANAFRDAFEDPRDTFMRVMGERLP